jgi:hypothetical protein
VTSTSSSSTTLDSAFERAARILEDANSNIAHISTEEDTKLQIITRILTDCLGWQFSDIGSEVKHDNGFSDYVLRDNDCEVLLLEAKRLGKLNVSVQENTKLRILKLNGPALRGSVEGVSQAANYASPNGLPVAVLTDGITWIVFKPYVQSRKYLDMSAFVFPSFEAIINDFSQFFDLLAKSQFRRKLYGPMFDSIHDSRLQLTTALVAPYESEDITLQPKSDIAFDLERVFSAFFERLSGDQDEDMLI